MAHGGPRTLDRVLHALRNAAEAPPRTYVAALVRHIAGQHSLAVPDAFAEDLRVTELDDALDALDELNDAPYPLTLIGALWETLLDADDRQQKGAHFTPPETTATVTSLTFDASDVDVAGVAPAVWDPACGGGAFLLAAAEFIATRSTQTRATIVQRLYASDIDPTALDVCRASLELWCRGEAEPTFACCDALLNLPPEWPQDFDVVIGNPPFLGQLASNTAREQSRRQLLGERYEAAAGAYVDDAGLFVELATERVRAGGAVGLILPESMLAARDAEPMRAMVAERATVTSLWIGGAGTFDASVDVVALVLHREPPNVSPKTETTVISTSSGSEPDTRCLTRTPEPASWGPLLAAGSTVPNINLLGKTPTLGHLVTVTAGFRQHFYGIADAVRNGVASQDTPKLVTSGAIDALNPMWGSRTVRFAKRSFERPVLHIDEIEDAAVRQWFVDRCTPKLLLASQTRVVEAIVDAAGTSVPSVPVVSVEPGTPERLWHLAAVLTSPAVSAHLARLAAGTGLSRNTIRVRAATIGEIPVPENSTAWDSGAQAAERAQAAAVAGDDDEYKTALEDLAESMNDAYGVEDRVTSWWWDQMGLTPYTPR